VYIDLRSQEQSELRVIFWPLSCLATILNIVFDYISALYIKNNQKLRLCYWKSVTGGA